MTNIAYNLIEKLGGVGEVARIAGVDISRVYRWTYSKDRGGTDGEIPRKHWQSLISAASIKGVELTAEDFFVMPKPAKPRGKK